MTLHVTKLSFRDFRSYESFDLRDIGMLSIFAGPNGVGKTNIIEGIQLLTALSTFRHASVDQLIRTTAPQSRLSAHVRDENRELDIALELEDHKKHYRLNDKPKRSTDLKGLVPSVCFTPDDLNFVKGSQSVRRHALDLLGSQLSANYHLVLKDCEKVLSHKNKLLKEGCAPLLLDSIDDALVVCGAQLTCYRFALFEKLSAHLKDLYEDLSSEREDFEARFAPSWEPFEPDAPQQSAPDRDQAREDLSAQLRAKRDEEIARKRALAGPQADTMNFMLNGFDATSYASQGQQRTIVLAYKLAEAAVIEEVLSQKPVLLLDDVMSELDEARREALTDYISHDVQTFITTANLAYFDFDTLPAASVIELPQNSTDDSEAFSEADKAFDNDKRA